MEAYEAIMTRRSIREYTAQLVPDDAIRELLAAAMNAPSASNQQPWQFVVVTERKQLDALVTALPYGQMLKRAPLAIAVCGDMQLQGEEYWVQDCSAATQNLLLAAHVKGLGAVWLGVYPRSDRVAEVGKTLNLPAHVISLCVVSIGYPLEPQLPVRRYNEARIHYNRW